jgi:hypothetical protein
MPKFTVHQRQYVDITVHVEADDETDAIEKAAEANPSGICGQCGGWGESWTRDDTGEIEPYEVVDVDGNTVWKETGRHA